MSETQFEVLKGWKDENLLEGVRILLTVSEVNNLSELLRLTQLAETYRKLFPLCIQCPDFINP